MRFCGITLTLAALLELAALLTVAPAQADPIVAGTTTHGGAVPGAAIVHVTSLSDSGPGSLRQALATQGPKVIVFDVGGVIHLASDLKIATPQTTIAGQSAPAPGVTLTGGSLRLRASDLVVQHIAVRPGPGDTPEINGNRDSLTIGGGARPVHDIRIENVSLTWSVDEDADLAGGTRNVTLRNSIIAEALRNAGHPKGRHSMGMLINKDNQAVAVTGNLFAANMFRNPVMARGSSAFIGYNLIADPGENAIHFYDVPAATPLLATVVGNIVEAGPDTANNVTAVQIPDDMAQKLPDARLDLADNRAVPGPVTNRGHFVLAHTPPIVPQSDFSPPADVAQFVLDHAGSHPAARDSVDTGIVAGVRAHTLRIVDRPTEQLGESAPAVVPADVPDAALAPSGIAGLLRIEAWLCARHLEAGGPQTPECPQNAAAYRDALNTRFSARR